VPILCKSGILQLMEPSGPVRACTGIAYLSFIINIQKTVRNIIWNIAVHNIVSNVFRRSIQVKIQGIYRKLSATLFEILLYTTLFQTFLGVLFKVKYKEYTENCPQHYLKYCCTPHCFKCF